MLGLVRRTYRVILVGSALAFAALVGWGSFAYTAVGYGQQVSVLTAERDSALAEAQRLRTTVGELSEVEARLGSARLEYNRVVHLGLMQRGGSWRRNRRLRNSQSGSIKPRTESIKPAASNPLNRQGVRLNRPIWQLHHGGRLAIASLLFLSDQRARRTTSSGTAR